MSTMNDGWKLTRFTIPAAVLAVSCGGFVDISPPAEQSALALSGPDEATGYDPGAACERLCRYGDECGTGGMPVPRTDCDCVGAGCSCPTQADCVDKCLTSLASLEQQESQCVDAAKRTLTCLQTAPCAPLRAIDGDAWFDASSCEDVNVPGDLKASCESFSRDSSTSGSFSTCSAVGTALSEGEAAGDHVSVPKCSVHLGCTDGEYSLSCERVDADSNLYACECARGQTQTSTYEVVNGCDWQNDGSLGSPDNLLSERCPEL